MQHYSKSIELWLVRHGETFDNINRIIAGHLPGQLTPLGERQATRTGQFLHKAIFDYAYVSDLSRTVATFNAIHEEIQQKIPASKTTFTKLMREKCGGEFEGQLIEVYRRSAAEQNISLRKFHGKGGECLEDVNLRARELILELARNHLGSDEISRGEGGDPIRILGISHGGFIMEVQNVCEWMLDRKTEENINHAKNCAIYQITITLKQSSLSEEGRPIDPINITLEDISVTIVDVNNNTHCTDVK